MDSAQIANYVFIIAGLLIISALILYKFFPKLRKNSFKIDGWEELPKYIELKERHKKEIESGEVLFIKGKYGDLFSNNKLITLMGVGSITLVVLMPYFLISLSENIEQCLFNEHFSLHLFIKDGDGFMLVYLLILLLQIQRLLRQILYGKRTGLDKKW